MLFEFVKVLLFQVKTPFKIFFIILLGIILFGAKTSAANTSYRKSVSTDKVILSSGNLYDQYSSKSLPQSNTIQIRHRSPRETDDIIIPYPVEEVNYAIDFTENATPECLSKWNAYFQFTIERLPDDQALPQSFSLRAPPFSC